MQYWLVMPAAGAGRRFGGQKQFATLGGARSVLEVALQPFLEDPQCAGGSIALAPGEPRRSELAQHIPARFALIDGGAERVHSVINGLAALAGRATATDWVLVHDAVRPCLSAADLARLLASAPEAGEGALLAVPVADTVKQVQPAAPGAPDGVRRCAATVPRESLWLAQTPQMFRHAPLRAALERALGSGRIPTDEAQAMEWEGVAALLVRACDHNIKVTNAADLGLAQAILAARAEQAWQ
jgi:2-C-methyl-D-erythritol 4-phosphate cytidylyltransferase